MQLKSGPFCLITCFVNSINCVWVAVAGLLVPDFIYNIGTTMLNGDILMLIFFFVNKIIFPEREAKKYRAIPHNSKCRYGERGAAAAKPKAQIILCVLSSILATQMPCRSRRSGA